MRLPVALLLFMAMPAIAQSTFLSFALAGDGTQLEFKDAQGVTWPAPKLHDQVGFNQPRISPDGRFLGWLALHPNCCTSYPIPLVLVVMDRNRHLYQFQGLQATFGWCFHADSSAVAYRREALHGPTPELFELRRIRDGRLLEAFEVPIEVSTGNAPRPRLPPWATCAAGV
jgi:hypothetical protein